MTGVACPCSDVDVSCLRCAEESCDCPVAGKYLLSWWTEDDLNRFVRTAETYLRKLADGQANAVSKEEPCCNCFVSCLRCWFSPSVLLCSDTMVCMVVCLFWRLGSGAWLVGFSCKIM